MTPALVRLGRGAVLGLALVLAGCGPNVTSATLVPPPVPTPTPSTAPVSTPPSPEAGPAVTIDPALLDVLPATVDGLEVVENPDGESAALGDPLLARVGTAMAAGFAIEPTRGEFVYAVVVRLVPGAMDALIFRDWRDSFDEGACSQAGGVVRNAEAEIGGRTVYIGTCAGLVRTYHVWLEERGLLISASALGERLMGELLIRNLRD